MWDPLPAYDVCLNFRRILSRCPPRFARILLRCLPRFRLSRAFWLRGCRPASTASPVLSLPHCTMSPYGHIGTAVPAVLPAFRTDNDTVHRGHGKISHCSHGTRWNLPLPLCRWSRAQYRPDSLSGGTPPGTGCPHRCYISLRRRTAGRRCSRMPAGCPCVPQSSPLRTGRNCTSALVSAP